MNKFFSIIFAFIVSVQCSYASDKNYNAYSLSEFNIQEMAYEYDLQTESFAVNKSLAKWFKSKETIPSAEEYRKHCLAEQEEYIINLEERYSEEESRRKKKCCSLPLVSCLAERVEISVKKTMSCPEFSLRSQEMKDR